MSSFAGLNAAHTNVRNAFVYVLMPFSNEDEALIKNLY